MGIGMYMCHSFAIEVLQAGGVQIASVLKRLWQNMNLIRKLLKEGKSLKEIVNTDGVPTPVNDVKNLKSSYPDAN